MYSNANETCEIYASRFEKHLESTWSLMIYSKTSLVDREGVVHGICFHPSSSCWTSLELGFEGASSQKIYSKRPAKVCKRIVLLTLGTPLSKNFPQKIVQSNKHHKYVANTKLWLLWLFRVSWKKNWWKSIYWIRFEEPSLAWWTNPPWRFFSSHFARCLSAVLWDPKTYGRLVNVMIKIVLIAAEILFYAADHTEVFLI